MSNPAYLGLTDENGSPIIGGCTVLKREGSIEIKITVSPSDNPNGP